MGIYKVSNECSKSASALNAVLNYVFGREGEDKTTLHNCIILGEYDLGKGISASEVYTQFQRNKAFWNNKKGRQYLHIIHSFHPAENITEQEATAITAEIIQKAYPGYQAVVVPHHDKIEKGQGYDVHVILNSVSYLDGRRIHLSKKDLQKQKELCNEVCRQNGYSVPVKGKNFYGHEIEPTTIIAWNKKKYKAIKTAPKVKHASQTHINMIQLLIVLIQALLYARGVKEFFEYLDRNSWKIYWTERGSDIAFQSHTTGRAFRASNIDRTFGSSLRFVFGDDFVLDKAHISALLGYSREHKQRLYGSHADAVLQEYLDVASPPQLIVSHQRKEKLWHPPIR